MARLASLGGIPDADPRDLVASLSLRHQPYAVGIYEVGQGNCNAILDSQFVALLYFDFGGGVTQNAKTFPPQLRHFCFFYKPTIVLSHWDWDHWSSARAKRDPEAQQQTWIVPRQTFGGVHGAMAASIVSSGRLLIWPNTLPALRVGFIEIRKCTGAPRNDDGLVLLAHDPQRERLPIRLTGDAQYEFMPEVFHTSYAGLVAMHHGGRMSSSAPKPSPAGNLVYSFGRDNSFDHAFPETRNWHIACGWTRALETANPKTPQPAHIAIGWGLLAPPVLRCHGHC